MADKIIGVFLAALWITALAIALSPKAKTTQVLGALLSGFVNIQKAAASPVTGK